jgi:hypothetical protein
MGMWLDKFFASFVPFRGQKNPRGEGAASREKGRLTFIRHPS